jgi:hypothetical protein
VGGSIGRFPIPPGASVVENTADGKQNEAIIGSVSPQKASTFYTSALPRADYKITMNELGTNGNQGSALGIEFHRPRLQGPHHRRVRRNRRQPGPLRQQRLPLNHPNQAVTPPPFRSTWTSTSYAVSARCRARIRHARKCCGAREACGAPGGQNIVVIMAFAVHSVPHGCPLLTHRPDVPR